MTRFEFQDVAISELCETFRTLWYAPGTQLPLVFKSPTGSGKTFMVTSFINDLTAVHNFDDDIAWVWITFSDDLAMQSKEKFSEYFYPNAGRRLLTVADFSEGKLRRNDILFLNWQKLVSGRAEARVLRKPNDPDKLKESGCYFEDVIAATKSARRKIALVIDESHKNVTEAAVRDVINPLDPKVIVKVSATPETEPSISDVKHHKAGFVEVERADVVKEGLIKSAIVSQTEDEVKTGSEESDMDHKLLDLAMKKRAALAARWTEVGSNVNPLVLIQLPDDDAGDRAQGIASKEDIVIAYLKSKGVTDDKIAWWFSGGSERKKNLEGISVNDCKVEYMLFKYAAGTGWDCPRSHVMVMFREINSTTFKIQTLGRILRNPEPRRKDELAAFPDLTVGYLYTNYSRNQVEGIDEKEKPNNPLLTRHAKLIDELASQIGAGADGYVIDEHLLSEYISRADYGDLGKASTFQASFAGSMDAYFGITADDQMGARTSRYGRTFIDNDPRHLLTGVSSQNADLTIIDSKPLLSQQLSTCPDEKFDLHLVKIARNRYIVSITRNPQSHPAAQIRQLRIEVCHEQICQMRTGRGALRQMSIQRADLREKNSRLPRETERLKKRFDGRESKRREEVL